MPAFALLFEQSAVTPEVKFIVLFPKMAKPKADTENRSFQDRWDAE